MYILIERSRLPEGRHYELMPDGRAIVSGREARMMGTLDGVTVVMNTAELERLLHVNIPEDEEVQTEQESAQEPVAEPAETEVQSTEQEDQQTGESPEEEQPAANEEETKEQEEQL